MRFYIIPFNQGVNMKLKLLILMILAVTVTACEENKGISTSYVEELEARVSVLEEELLTVKKRVAYFEGVSASLIDKVSSQQSTYHCHQITDRTGNMNTLKEVCD